MVENAIARHLNKVFPTNTHNNPPHQSPHDPSHLLLKEFHCIHSAHYCYSKHTHSQKVAKQLEVLSSSLSVVTLHLEDIYCSSDN
jgi:hypothetical protein